MTLETSCRAIQWAINVPEVLLASAGVSRQQPTTCVVQCVCVGGRGQTHCCLVETLARLSLCAGRGRGSSTNSGTENVATGCLHNIQIQHYKGPCVPAFVCDSNTVSCMCTCDLPRCRWYAVAWAGPEAVQAAAVTTSGAPRHMPRYDTWSRFAMPTTLSPCCVDIKASLSHSIDRYNHLPPLLALTIIRPTRSKCWLSVHMC